MQDTYTLLREFADSWMLLALFAWFVGAFLWVWRPGSRPLHDDAARMIFSPESEVLSAEAPEASRPDTETRA